MIRDEAVLKQLSALYVEDNDAMRESLGKYMRRRFGELWLSQNGKEGLELYKKHCPDIVITDIEMPVMDGITMITKIREINDDQPIIITTAFNDDEHTNIRCLNLIKPIDAERLIDAVLYCVGKVS
ncbi:MAG: response regulator [Nitrospirae bacterium]|nr:response regulator [Nitrospirota bacterium]